MVSPLTPTSIFFENLKFFCGTAIIYLIARRDSQTFLVVCSIGTSTQYESSYCVGKLQSRFLKNTRFLQYQIGLILSRQFLWGNQETSYTDFKNFHQKHILMIINRIKIILQCTCLHEELGRFVMRNFYRISSSSLGGAKSSTPNMKL